MGFGIGFILLVFVSLALFVYFIFSRANKALIVIVSIWCLAICFMATATAVDYYQSPLRLMKNEIIGTYRIDTNIFPGKNSKWQREHYWFQITSHDTVVLFKVDGNKKERFKSWRIWWRMGPPWLWQVQCNDTTSCEIFKRAPTLYRSHKRFYYVLWSSSYGNMFFRKS